MLESLHHLPEKHWVWILSAAMGACAPGSVARSTAPQQQTYADATGSPTVKVAEGSNEPLIVDWNPEQRADLEVTMAAGIAVVSYTGGELKLLKRCEVLGSYGFKSVTRKERVIRMESMDEIRANLPVTGVATVGAELERGGGVDIALVIVGKRLSSRPSVARDALKGECGGATHFVYAATTGAFAMATGTRARAASVAELFGAVASGSSSDDREQRTRDGDLAACQKGTARDLEPPEQCGALLRLDLSPIVAETPKEGETSAVARCPAHLVWKNDRCTLEAGAHLCDPKDSADCLLQCNAGDVESCGSLAKLVWHSKDPKGSLGTYGAALGKGCDGGSAWSCFLLGYAANFLSDKEPRGDEAERLYLRACDLGEPRGCGNLATMFELGEGRHQDGARARALQEVACVAGLPLSCRNLGRYHRQAIGGPVDPARSAEAYRKAATLAAASCDAGVGQSCFTLALMIKAGDEGLAADQQREQALHRRACTLGFGTSCNLVKPSQ